MPQNIQYVLDADGNYVPLVTNTTSYRNTTDTLGNLSPTPGLNIGGQSLVADDDGPWNRTYRTPSPTNTANGASTPNTSVSVDAPEIKARQQDLVDRGYDLGDFGVNKDGVDGDWGTKSKKAAKWDADLKTKASTDWGISTDDLEWIANPTPGADQPGYGTSWGIYKPKHGTKSSYGDIYNSETGMFEDEFYAYDAEGNAISKEEFTKLYGELDENNDYVVENKKKKEGEDTRSWLQRIGINNITDAIEMLSIIKTQRHAAKKLKELSQLKVKTKKVTPVGIQLERVDLGAEKKKISELGVAALDKGMREGLSTAELRALTTATQDSLTDVGVEEAKLNREISNLEKIENAKERRAVQTLNITNDRQDQMDNNEIMADAIAGSIAIFNQMRDAVSTKIKDAKLLRSAENQMTIFAQAISGGTGLDNRKLLPAIQTMMGNGTLSEKDGQILLGHMKTIEEQDKKQ